MSTCSRSRAGTAAQRRAVVDGVTRSLATGFVYTSHDVSEDLLDTAYGMLREFFSQSQDSKQQFAAPGANGQTGYTGLLVETAASSDQPDWKEMLNWATPIPAGHPLKRKFPTAYPDQVLPEAAVPGITKVLYEFHDAIADLQRRFLRVIAEGIGCHETFFDEMVADGPTLTRAIRYPPMAEVPGDGPRVGGRARRHQPDHRAAAGHRAGPAGEGRRRMGRRRRARAPGDHQHRDHARAPHERRDPDRLAPRRRRARLRGRAVQRRAVLPPATVDDPVAGSELLHAGAPAALQRDLAPPTRSTKCCTRSTSSRPPRRVVIRSLTTG